MRLVIVGESSYIGSISQTTYDETDWGTSSDDYIRFTDESGMYVWMNLAEVCSLNFGGVAPAPGEYDLYRVRSKHGGRDGVDSLIDEDAKDALLADLATANASSIITFNTVQGVEVRLVMGRAVQVRVEPESLVVSEP